MTESSIPMIPDQRREALVRLLRREPVLSVHQLTEMLGVSHMTVRRDIAQLEQEGRAVSVPGGVRVAAAVHSEPVLTVKTGVEVAEKRAIAAAAQRWITDDMTVYLDAGTTIGALVDAVLERHDLTVVTNDFTTVERLAAAGHPRTIHIGGIVDVRNRSSVGLLAAETLRKLNVDLALLSTSSWDLSRGITTPYEQKIEVKRAAAEVAARAVLLASSSKFGSFGMYDVMPLARLDAVVTDWHLPASAAEGIGELGIEVVRAPSID